ncbi:MAG TPA: S-layer homology domain-containing protein [Bacillota bacterium]|nr:S-layer homology domain-containing protein [Bacillota bacterium]
MKKWVSLSLLFTITFFSASSYAESLNKRNMVYLYGSDSSVYEQELDKTLGMVGTIAPDYFHLTDDGNLISKIDPVFVQDAKQKGYIVTPFISNDWNQSVAIKAMQNGDKLADDLANAVIKGNLDGVDIDIENLTPDQKELQTSFIKKLTDKLKPNGKTVSIAVPPTTIDNTKGWVGSYDYEDIGKMVDYVFVMGYDYSYPNGPSGPVAPLSWVDDSLRYMTTKIAPSKLILGVPFYGRYWSDQKKGMGILESKTLDLAQSQHSTIQFDSASSSMVAHLISSNGGPMDVWFDNASTLKQKIQLVDKYHLAGWGGWHLGQEDPQLWMYLRDQIPYFWDIGNHWAQKEIIELSKQNLISGYEDHSFHPQQNISREEVAALLVRLMKFDTGKQADFEDVQSNDWSYSSISTMAGQGVMSGYPDRLFKPTQPITRAEFASVLNRCFPNLTTTKTVTSLNDIDQHWAKAAIQALANAGIIGGYSDGTFQPDRPVSRAEATAMIWRILQSKTS